MKHKHRKRHIARIRTNGDPILKQVCEPVAQGEDISAILRDMRQVLLNSKTGIGLAAPQAGHTKRIIALSPNGFIQFMINPVMVEHTQQTNSGVEGCLSYPGFQKQVIRFSNIFVIWVDEQGNDRGTRLTNMDARIFQHELDHLEGKCPLGDI